MLARIVVIEDDVYMREELIDMLKKAGYDAVPLPAFENAVSQLAELSPDLILLDINLPFRSGFEICKEIKAKHLGAVLILTARDKLQDELHALGLGADDYLTIWNVYLPAQKIFCAAERSRCSKDYSTGAASCLIQILLRYMQEKPLMFYRRMREKSFLLF